MIERTLNPLHYLTLVRILLAHHYVWHGIIIVNEIRPLDILTYALRKMIIEAYSGFYPSLSVPVSKPITYSGERDASYFYMCHSSSLLLIDFGWNKFMFLSIPTND